MLHLFAYLFFKTIKLYSLVLLSSAVTVILNVFLPSFKTCSPISPETVAFESKGVAVIFIDSTSAKKGSSIYIFPVSLFSKSDFVISPLPLELSTEIFIDVNLDSSDSATNILSGMV